MELTPAQLFQVRLLKFGAVLIFALLGLFIYLSIKYPETNAVRGNLATTTAEAPLSGAPNLESTQATEDYKEGEYIDVIGEVREYGADSGGGDVVHYMYTFLIPARDTTEHQYEMVRIDNNISCVEASLYRGHPQVHIRGVIEKVVPNFALIMSCTTKETSVTRVTTGPCWASGNAVRESYRIADGKVYCGDEVLPEADPATFSLLPGLLGDEVGVGVSGLARDMDTVFVGTHALPNADVSSFQLLKGNYARDSEQVYYYDSATAEVRVGAGADPATFIAYTADTDTYVRLYDSMSDPGFASDTHRNYKAGEAYSGVMPSYVFE